LASKQYLLALDGDEAVLKAIAHYAAPFYQVLSTRDPRRFLAWMENTHNVSVIVTEHVLQTASGVALLQSARSMCPTARRILLTTYHDLASIVDGLHSGAIERLVQKPFSAKELLLAIMPENTAGESSDVRASA
jgi:DNA-binding NtrC family response regulator